MLVCYHKIRNHVLYVDRGTISTEYFICKMLQVLQIEGIVIQDQISVNFVHHEASCICNSIIKWHPINGIEHILLDISQILHIKITLAALFCSLYILSLLTILGHLPQTIDALSMWGKTIELCTILRMSNLTQSLIYFL